MPIMTNVLRSLGNLSLSPGTDLDTGQMKSRTWTLLPEIWSEQKAMVYSLPNGNRKNISSQLSFARSRNGNLRGYRSFHSDPLKNNTNISPNWDIRLRKGDFYMIYGWPTILQIFLGALIDIKIMRNVYDISEFLYST